MKIEKLPSCLSKNGFLYKLVERTDKCAIYEQCEQNGDSTGHWEVFKIKSYDPRKKAKYFYEKEGKPFNADEFPDLKEAFAADNDFGKTAWCFTDLAKARAKFKELG